VLRICLGARRPSPSSPSCTRGARSGWFAWLFVEWGDNLWIAIGLHWWMNVAWEAFGMGATAVSGAPAVEALRAATVLASVGWTAAMARRRGGPRLGRAALWRQRPS